MKKPNILYIHSHDTGRYIQPYGHAVPTPRMQKLAEQGVLFRQNFCVNPTCSASRSALVTGSYPHENGMTGLAHRGWSLNDYGQHIIHTLHGQGYNSILAGVQHVAHRTPESPAWKTIGYNECLEGEQFRAAAGFLGNVPTQPWFLSVGFTETHRQFPAIESAPDDFRYCLPPAPLPDTHETRQDMARYKASARELDRKMGIVFDALEESGLSERTIVICTTDHGIAFPRMKCNLHDSGIGTMLIIRGPERFTGGRVVDGMTSHMDIFPTICDLLDIEPPEWLRGRSLLPLVDGTTEQIHDELFFEVNYHAAYEPMRAVRTSRWKYIKRFDERDTPVMPNCDDGESKSIWLDAGWPKRSVEKETLFDLIFDPNETNNLAESPEHAGMLADMKRRMQNWMKDTNDPLLSGEVPAPAGAGVNDPNGLSPGDALLDA